MNSTIHYLRSPETIRSHCHQLFELAQRDQLHHFRLAEEKIPDAIAYVIKEININYPDHQIPYHSRFRHFEAGGIDRISELMDHKLRSHHSHEKAKILFELAIISVLVDAGAGDNWTYTEHSSGKTHTRSEGLAVASFHMFLQGLFSSDPHTPLQVDADKLIHLSEDQLRESFQVTENNPLIGISGRTTLLNRLGRELKKQPGLIRDTNNPRLGELFDHLFSISTQGKLEARVIFQTILEIFADIWPQGHVVNGHNLGDIGHHSLVKGPFGTDGLVPFHKLSQWLSYSLFEPFEAAGLTIIGANQLTGLPEYRNGGLLIDTQILLPRDATFLSQIHHPQSEAIVEWRALTVVLLDVIYDDIRKKLKKKYDEFPLVKVLQGGTWSAGRRKALDLRPHGSSPVRIHSDGTLF